MRQSLVALALVASVSTPAVAQSTIIGSGVTPAAVANSAQRPIGFATTPSVRGVQVVPMDNANVPTGIVNAATAQTISAAIASAKKEAYCRFAALADMQ